MALPVYFFTFIACFQFFFSCSKRTTGELTPGQVVHGVIARQVRVRQSGNRIASAWFDLCANKFSFLFGRHFFIFLSFGQRTGTCRPPPPVE